MAKTPSTMLPLGTPLPAFALKDPGGKLVTDDDVLGPKGLLVMFICNHCPFVQHVAAELAKLAKDCRSQGIGVVGIMSNDVATYPADRPELMAEESRLRGYDFPYLHDETQGVARAFAAACTPDFYLFDPGRRLVYRGQLDDSRPGNGVPVTGKDLRAATAALAAGAAIPTAQQPSIGCNIKWRAT